MKRVAILPAVVALLVVLVGVRAGWVAAVVVGGIAVLVMGATLALMVVLARRAPAPVAAGVQHCGCCDRSCLFAEVCEPGATPTTVHS